MVHINFTTKADFIGSLNAIAEQGTTPFILIDCLGAFANDINTKDFENLVAYWLDYNAKQFEQFVITRLNTSYNDSVLVYCVGFDFKKISQQFFIRCANAKIYWRILTPSPLQQFNVNYACFDVVTDEQEAITSEHNYLYQERKAPPGMNNEQLEALQKHLNNLAKRCNEKIAS